MNMDNGTSGNDAATPVISNRKATAPRFSSLDGPVLRVEYYREPYIPSEAVSTNHEMVGAAVQLGLQVSRVVWKRSLSMIAMSSRRRQASTRQVHGKPPVVGIPNFGQTCFANAILQALAASSSMKEYLEQIREFSTTADQLYTVLQKLRMGDSEVDPRPLLRKFYSTTHEQNDAQEFLQRMIDSIVAQIDWDAYECHLERSRKTPQQEIVGAMVITDAKDDDLWSISSCQEAVRKKKSLASVKTTSDPSPVDSNVLTSLDESQPIKPIGFLSGDKTTMLNGYTTNGMNGSNNSSGQIGVSRCESKQSEDNDSTEDLSENFSKDTVISAETVWIHSYSLGEEKKDDSSHLHTGLEVLKKEAFHVDVKAKIEEPQKPTYSALSPSPLHGWMGSVLVCDTCKSRDRPIPNALCCTIPVLPKHAHVVDCVQSVLAPEHIERVQCDYCPRDPALELERQDWVNAIRHTAGDTTAMEAELEQVEEALKVPIYSDATKASLLMRLPVLLSLHIQRRQVDGQKNLQHVQFDESFTINGARYRLIAVIEHLGGPNSGHYVCYRPRWWRISDRQIHRIEWNQVRKAQAYMLFYERTQSAAKTADPNA